tara:strand:- start:227 stop:1909 length:1683 start_codon:yes stop_codon:yes gene_type:complete
VGIFTDISDFFSKEAGQSRRQTLEDFSEKYLDDPLDYYLGPTGIPDKLRAVNELFNPIIPLEDATVSFQEGDYAGSAIDFASVALPVAGAVALKPVLKTSPEIIENASKAVQETLTGLSMGASGIGRSALDLVDRIEVDKNTLGMGGGNVRFRPPTGTGVNQAKEAVDEGLRYTQDQGALGNLLNRYYSNMNRGSKLTRRGQMQDTDLGRLKVNVGRVPLQETGRTIVKPDDVVGVEPFPLEKFFDEDVAMVPMVWDRSDLGVLKGVNDQPLAFDVPLQAGSQYPTTSSNFDADRLGASHQSVVTSFMNASKRASGQKVDKKTGEIITEGKPVFGVFSNMGGESNDFSTMVSDTLLGMMPSSKMTKKSIKEFDELMSERVDDWPGLKNVQDSPEKMQELREFLNRPEGGNDRKIFVKTMEDAKWNDKGFPDVVSARAATSVQDMFGMGTGDATGRIIGQVDYNAPTTRVTEHGSYPVSIPRVPNTPIYRLADEGGAFVDIPRDFILPDYLEARRLAGKPEVSDTRAITMSVPSQDLTPKVIDNMMMEIRRRANRGYPYNR